MNPIATNIRNLRGSRQWTQEDLAAEAGVDIRTVQRAESGQPLSIDSLRAIAAAFDSTVDALSVNTERIQKEIEEFLRRHTTINLTEINRAPELEPLLAGADAWYFHKVGLTTDAEEDAAAEFEQDVSDWANMWNELEPLERRDAVRHLQTLLESIWDAGLAVAAGATVRRLRSGHGGSVVFNILYVALSPAKDPQRIFFQDNSVPLSSR